MRNRWLAFKSSDCYCKCKNEPRYTPRGKFCSHHVSCVTVLISGETQMIHYPGLTRGLVAVLLYHDGRRCISTALRTLIQVREGRRCTSNISRDMSALITKYTDELMRDGLVEKILG